MTEQAVDPLDGLVNVRDLGGLPTDMELVTRTGVLYRSDAPHVGDREPEGITEWPPKVVVDLRDTMEGAGDEHPLHNESEIHRIPLLEDLRTSAENDDRVSLQALYLHILEEAPKRVLEVFRVAAGANGPVLVHCSAGKDRTGVIAALLMRTAGVRSDSVIADYVRTDRNMYRVLQRLNVAQSLPPGVDEDSIRELISAPAEAIEAVLDRLDGHSGGAVGWLVAQGATSAEITRWQQRFLGSPE